MRGRITNTLYLNEANYEQGKTCIFIQAWFQYRRKGRRRPSIDVEITVMHRGHSQKLN